MKRFSLISIIFGIVLFTGCSSQKQKEQLAQVDSLKQSLDTIDERFNTLDSSIIARNFERTLKSTELLHLAPEDDKQKEELIALHRQSEKVYRKYLENTDRLIHELERSYEQVQDLAADVKNDNIPEGQFKNYYRDEKKMVKRLREMVFYIVEENRYELERADSLEEVTEQYLRKHDISYGE
ncbi:MAG: hypothetical protein R6U19_09560 [Bacteroidales bacterium]